MIDLLTLAMARKKSGTGGTGGNESIKAFETIPATNKVRNKHIVPLIDFEAVASNYTDSSDVLDCSFTFGDSGTTYILALALRAPVGEPTLPDGFEKLAWINPPEGSTNDQWLYVAKRTITADDEKTTCSLSFAVTQGKRNYLLVAQIGDSSLSGEMNVTAESDVKEVVPYCYGHTIIVFSSETTSTNKKVAGEAWFLEEGYGCILMENFKDEHIEGGRLAMAYIPWRNEQPFENPTFRLYERIYSGTSSNFYGTKGVITCSLELLPGTPSKYYCTF